MRPQNLVIVILFYNFITVNCECSKERPKNENYEAELEKDLFCSYRHDYRPVQDHNQTVTVGVMLAIRYITFDETEEIFTVHSRLGLTWQDAFLKWDPSNYGGIKELLIRSHKIWIPRLALFNSDASLYQSDSFYTTCLVQYNGTVFCAPYDAHSGLCRTWLRKWPYDTQKCTLYFGSWMHRGGQVNITFQRKTAVAYESFDDGPGWKLLNVSQVWLVGRYNSSPSETYPMLKYIFYLQREARGIEAIIVVPSLVLLVITTTTLLIDVKEDMRLALQCFSLFGHLLLLDEIAYYLPKQNMETPVVLLFVRDSMMMALISIVLTLLLTPLRERTEAPPSWLMKLSGLLTSGPGKYVVFTEFEPPEYPERPTHPEPDINEEQHNVASTWMSLANALNSVVFIIYVIAYISLFSVYIAKE